MENELKQLFNGTDYPGKNLKIFTYPAPVLKIIGQPVKDFNDELKNFVIDMVHTMYSAPGIGLAAPQVGKSLRLFVSDTEFEREEIGEDENGEAIFKNINLSPKVYINPKITKKSGEILYEEGCLSVPGIYEEVKRFEKITMEFQDLTGGKLTIEAEGLEAVCLQHELDHLNGVVFIEKLSPMKKMLITKKFLKKK